MGKKSSKAAPVGTPEPTEPPPLPNMPSEEYYARATDPGQTFNRGHQLQVTGSPHAMAYGSRPIDWTKAGMLAQRMPGLQDLLARSFQGQFKNTAPPEPVAVAPPPQAAAPQPHFDPGWRATSDYEIAMNDGIDPRPWATAWANARDRRR